MKAELFEALVQHIAKEGLHGQITVRPCKCEQIEGEHYEIIDGENRFIAAQDRRVDLQEINCLIVEKNDVDARIETMNYNLEHGEIVQEKLDALMAELEHQGSMSKEQVAGALFIPLEELTIKLAPVKIEPEPLKLNDLKAKKKTFNLSVRLHSNEELEFVRSVLSKIQNELSCDEGSAVVRVFREYKGASFQ